MAAQKAAKLAGEQAMRNIEKRSKKALQKLVIEMSESLAKKNVPKLGYVIRGLCGTIINLVFLVTGTTLGKVIANVLNRIDGKRKDRYIFA